MDTKSVSFITFEAEMFRHEKTIKRLFAIIIVEAFVILAIGVGWAWSVTKVVQTTNQSETAISTCQCAGQPGCDAQLNASPEESRRKTQVGRPKRGG